LYFDTSKVDKQLGIILVGYNNSIVEYQETVDIKIAAFLDRYNLYTDIEEYCIQYRKPTSILDYILLYRRLETILAPRLYFILLDLQRVYNFVEFDRNIELLVEY
jgi:hypothetical protein